MSSHCILILCGGKGTRLSSVWTKPKALVPILGVSYLQYIIEQLTEACSNKYKIHLATGHMSSEIEKTLTGFKNEVVVNCENKPLGTGGAVASFLNDTTYEKITILNGDTLFHHLDLKAHFALIENGAPNIVAAAPIARNERFGSISVEKFLMIQKNSEMKINDLTFAGLITLRKEDLFLCSTYPYALEDLINISKIPANSVLLKRVQYGFHDIGTPKSLELADQWLRN